MITEYGEGQMVDYLAVNEYLDIVVMSGPDWDSFMWKLKLSDEQEQEQEQEEAQRCEEWNDILPGADETLPGDDLIQGLHYEIAELEQMLAADRSALKQTQQLCVLLCDAVKAYATAPQGSTQEAWERRQGLISEAGARLAEHDVEWVEKVAKWRRWMT